MIVTWTITESAVWDWTYSSFESNAGGLNNTVQGNSLTAATTSVTDTGAGTELTVLYDSASDTGTYYTSTTSEVATTIRTTTTSYDTDAGISQNIFSASYDPAASQIVTFHEPTTATVTASSNVSSTVLSTASSGTYLKPLGFPIWLDVDLGDDAYAPTVVAWSSAAGYSQPAATNATSLPGTATLAFAGQTTLYPATDMFQIPSATDGGSPTSITETWQSQTITWTRSTQTAATFTGELLYAPAITNDTETYQSTVYSTRTTSSVFLKQHTYRDFSVPATSSWPSWWESTTLAASTFVDSESTVSGHGTTTVLVSSAAKSSINILQENQAGQQPLAAFETSVSLLRGALGFGAYSHFYSQNAGYALNATQSAGAAISPASQSFPLPAQSFATVLLQRGVSAPLPFQTRSSTSSNSTTSWSLGATALTITTSSTNSTTYGSTSSSYALSVAPPTLWTSSSRAIQSTSYTAAGGNYGNNSLFVAGGLFTATEGTSEFTATAITAGTNATAVQPLPHFSPELGAPSAATYQQGVSTSAVGGLPVVAFPLTA